MKIAQTILDMTRKWRVAINILACSLIFGFLGSRPRETISGFIGRKSDPDQLERYYRRKRHISIVWRSARRFIDLITFEPGHCWRCG